MYKRQGIPALRIISLSYSLAGFGIVCDSIYMAFGNGMLSLIVGIARPVSYTHLDVYKRQGFKGDNRTL